MSAPATLPTHSSFTKGVKKTCSCPANMFRRRKCSKHFSRQDNVRRLAACHQENSSRSEFDILIEGEGPLQWLEHCEGDHPGIKQPAVLCSEYMCTQHVVLILVRNIRIYSFIQTTQARALTHTHTQGYTHAREQKSACRL